MLGLEPTIRCSTSSKIRLGPSGSSRPCERLGSGALYFRQLVLSMGRRLYPDSGECPFSLQTSLYGASKVACEGLISAYSEGFGFQGLVFRFVSILGPRYTHGHICHFYRQLRSDPLHLLILGDGRQKKSYLHISDCIAAI